MLFVINTSMISIRYIVYIILINAYNYYIKKYSSIIYTKIQ